MNLATTAASAPALWTNQHKRDTLTAFGLALINGFIQFTEAGAVVAPFTLTNGSGIDAAQAALWTEVLNSEGWPALNPDKWAAGLDRKERDQLKRYYINLTQGKERARRKQKPSFLSRLRRGKVQGRRGI